MCCAFPARLRPSSTLPRICVPRRRTSYFMARRAVAMSSRPLSISRCVASFGSKSDLKGRVHRRGCSNVPMPRAAICASTSARLSLGLAGAAVSAVGVLVYAAAPWRPARTATGEALTLRAAGFEHFLRTAEAERQRFAERERLFEDYLPYAIAFGFVDEWVRGFGLVDRPGDFDAPAPARVPLRPELVGLVRQLSASAQNREPEQARRD